MTYFNRLIVNSTVFSLTLLKLKKKKRYVSAIADTATDCLRFLVMCE